MGRGTSELSPKPWKLYPEESGPNDYARDANKDMVFACLSMDSGETDAAYIVRAVNNHEALVKLAKEVLICVRDEDDTFDLKYEARKILASLEK